MNKKGNAFLEAIVYVALIVAITLIGSTIYLFATNYKTYEPVAEISFNYNDYEADKPDYEYLRSVSVYIQGCSRECIGGIDEESYGYGKGVQLVDACYDTECWGGSGSVIAEKEGYTYILTNAHVAGRGKDNIKLFIKNDLRQTPAELVKCDKILDMAVLKVKGTLRGKSPMKGIGYAVPGDKVYIVGNHLGREAFYGEGVMAGYDDAYSVFQLPIAPGNSGSGIFDEDGNMVAIAFAVNVMGGGWVQHPVLTHALAIDSLSIEIFLEDLDLIEVE